MNNKIITTRLEYLSLLLVISFVVFHNIFIVLIGIVLSLYILNKNLILNSLNSTIIKTILRRLNTKISPIAKPKLLIDTKKDDSQISLVEAIEESGYIPSIETNRTNDVA